MRKLSLLLLATLLVLLLFACGHHHHNFDWPELEEFDQISGEIEKNIQLGMSAEELSEQIAALKQSGHRLLASDIPKDADSPAQVRLRLDELKVLLTSLDDVDDINQLDTDLLMAFHPLTKSIIDVSGMVHVCDH